MGTKAIEIESGCFHAAMPDEPMFVLLARDPKAPELVRQWAADREWDISAGARPKEDRPKVQEAYELADKMEWWRTENYGAWRVAPPTASEEGRD